MVRQLIPEGLVDMVPGPELGVLLAGIDIHALTGADAVEVLWARAQQLSHEQARLLATMVEVGLCDPDAGVGEVARLVESPPYAADEIRAALARTATLLSENTTSLKPWYSGCPRCSPRWTPPHLPATRGVLRAAIGALMPSRNALGALLGHQRSVVCRGEVRLHHLGHPRRS